MTTLAACELVIDIPQRGAGEALDFSINGGDIWGVLGPNGAGKTTLLHTLAGLKKPRHGHVSLDGKDIRQYRRKEIAQQLAVVFQERQDGFPGTVLETAMIGRHPFLKPWDVESATDVAIASDALKALALGGMEQRLVSTLSGGERQRLAIATAATQTPTLWLADEPSNHLDLKHQVSVMALLAEQAKSGCGVFLCLHDLNLAAHWCTNILLLFPNGEACWGPTDTMLTTENLQRLYDQSLRAIVVDGKQYFVATHHA